MEMGPLEFLILALVSIVFSVIFRSIFNNAQGACKSSLWLQIDKSGNVDFQSRIAAKLGNVHGVQMRQQLQRLIAPYYPPSRVIDEVQIVQDDDANTCDL